MRKTIRILMTFIMFLLFLYSFLILTSYATSGSALVGSFQGANAEVDGEGIVKDIIGIVLSAVRLVATGMSIIIITFLGIQYMSAAPNEKANIKTKLISFTVGAVVVIGAVKLLEIIKGFAQSL